MAERSWTSVLSLSAIASALVSVACCLPLGILGLVAAMSLAAAIAPARPWLLLLSGVFLVVGVIQLERGPKCGPRRRWMRFLLLSAAAVVVVFVLIFPDVLAGFLADFFYRSR